MQNKRGQFYIVTAIVIVIMIIGLTGITTYVYSKSSPSNIYELSSELKQESSKVIDYGVYTGENRLSDFAKEDFAKYFIPKTDNTKLSFVYGTSEGVYQVDYDTTDKGNIVLAEIGTWPITSRKITQTFRDLGEDNVEITLLGQIYNFELKPGENFYFVISHEEGDEVFVETSERKVKICHKYQEEDKDKYETQSVSESSLKTHLAHGDCTGECDDEDSECDDE